MVAEEEEGPRRGRRVRRVRAGLCSSGALFRPRRQPVADGNVRKSPKMLTVRNYSSVKLKPKTRNPGWARTGNPGANAGVQ